MKKDNRERLFEVMGKLDKTFKPKLNEDFDKEKEAIVSEEISIDVEVGDTIMMGKICAKSSYDTDKKYKNSKKRSVWRNR